MAGFEVLQSARTFLLIALPAGPISLRAEVEAWTTELREMLVAHGNRPDIRDAIADAERWVGDTGPA